ncbi:hypothetical protein [Puniceicoccus vermicola]|uniref:Uncharacterized protein n=1 Tax=Puniceicoccus vermicola TaxID=388746 RepID=A0A7X1AYT2_9BACT|nr:hypothetical protein [Puniceicoccus vermicola]MBC2601423.1 hypothetical protein [Puniceicoccus vermicola]
MDVAIVTGADTRFGDAVCRTLLKMGFRIHALGQNPDPAGYDSRYYIPHSYGPGKLAELKGALEEALAAEGRLDLLVGLGGPEITTGWENSSPEALVRRLHGCLTEPLLAASVCLGALKKSKGFLIHGHRRPVAKDLSVAPGYFEDSMRKAYDDLFIRNAAAGLRSARILYAYPEEENEDSTVYQDVADSVSRAFEIILRQKETCIVREMHITPRSLGPVGVFPNLVSGMDPYQTTVLPEGGTEEEEPILIPTEKPRHYIQIAEVKDITDGDVEVDEHYADEEEDELDRRDSRDSSQDQKPSRRRRRSRGRSRRRKGDGDSRDSDSETNKDQQPKSDEESSPKESNKKSRPQKESPEENSEPAKNESREESKPEETQDKPKQKPRPRHNRTRKPENESKQAEATTDETATRAPVDSSSDDVEPTKPKKRTTRKTTRKKAAPARKRAPRKTAKSGDDSTPPPETTPPPSPDPE